MGAGIQRWWRDPDRLQHECDAFDGKEPQLAEHVKWWRDQLINWATLPLYPEPRFNPIPVSDSIEIRVRHYGYWCDVCRAIYTDGPHWHGIFNIDLA